MKSPVKSIITIDLTLDEEESTPPIPRERDSTPLKSVGNRADYSSDVEIVAYSPAKARHTNKNKNLKSPVPKTKEKESSIDIDTEDDRILTRREDKGKARAVVIATPRPPGTPHTEKSSKEKGRGKGKARADDDEDDGILIVDGDRYIQPSKQHFDDERLARKLAEEEQAEIDAIAKKIKHQNDGIVFKVTIDATNQTLEDGSPALQDDIDRFQPWKELFEKSGYRVKRFHWIVNVELHERFEKARRMLKYLTDKEPEEKMLFHGTAVGNIEPILSSGFRIGGVNGHPITNGAAIGRGIYLAGDAATSIGYGAGADRIFACRVLPGRITGDIQYSMKYPPGPELGKEPFECYNPHPTGPGQVYVVRYTCLVLPCYMIEYDILTNGVNNMGFGRPLRAQLPFAGLPPVFPRTAVMQIPPVINPPRAPARRKRKAPAPRDDGDTGDDDDDFVPNSPLTRRRKKAT